MDLVKYIKNNFTKLPFGVGATLSRIPYSVRPGVGRLYRQRVEELKQTDAMSPEQRNSFVFQRVKDIVQYAQTNIQFYQELYSQKDFHFSKLQSFDDLELIPVTSKAMFQDYDLEQRSNEGIPKITKVNTGGSSGKPLSFYIQSSSVAHERAHMMTAWQRGLNYRPTDLLATFNGRSEVTNPIEYDGLRHTYNVNIYCDHKSVARELKRILPTRKIRFLHGYPSAIYEFALYCQQDTELLDLLKGSLKGLLFGSEFPNPHWRRLMEETFGVKSLAWYGHTERCVLAPEQDTPLVFCPMVSYGFAEAKLIEGATCLIGTSYYNEATPLIRYNTEDEIEPIETVDGLLTKFRISGGRTGEYVVDRDGNKISLTGLIFGRHHRLFDFCSHIQVGQTQPGTATIVYTPLGEPVPEPTSQFFDTDNIAIDFEFKSVAQPIKTVSGKIKLLVNIEEAGLTQ